VANLIKIKQSSTASAVPTAGQLSQGELAINVTDQKLYSKDATTVFEIGNSVTAISDLSDVSDAGVSNNDILFYNGGSWIDSAGSLTYNGVGAFGVGDLAGTAGILTVKDGISTSNQVVITASAGTVAATGAVTGSNLNVSTWDALVSNATHTGDVTGSVALAIDPTAISGKTLVTAVASDMVLVWDATDSALKRVNASDFLSAGSVAAGDITAGDLGADVLQYFTTSGTNTAYKVPFINTSGSTPGGYAMYMDSAGFTYNPSTNTLFASALSGGGTGITSFNGSNITAGSVGVLHGGTNQTSWTQGDILYCSATNVLSKLAKGTSGDVLTMNATVPTWATGAGVLKGVMYVGSGSGAISATTAWVTVDLATEYYDLETNYSLATDVITVTDAGDYLISYVYTYHPTGGATNDSIKCRMTKNGTTTVLTGSTTQALIYKSNTRPSQVTCTFLARLAANDTVRLQQACETGTTGTEIGTSINVTLVKIG
jgi:hypothetical protein